MVQYNLSVGAIFKNESHSILEWIQHYLHHGVDHFYLINDASTDTSVELLQSYIDSGKVTLFHAQERYYLGRQRNLYNKYILPHVQETKWLLMVDLDEYVWSKKAVNLYTVISSFETYGQVQILENLFGSNDHIIQPRSLVESFTKRRAYTSKENSRLKYFIHTSYGFSSLNIHHADFTERKHTYDHSKFIIATSEYFCMNHYNCQSRSFWDTVKCTRGDADHYLVRKPEDFSRYDINEIEDLDLYNQNKELYIQEIKSDDTIGNELGPDQTVCKDTKSEAESA